MEIILGVNMKYLRPICLVLALATQIGPAHAESATRKVGDTDIKFAVPDGYCVLSQSNNRDAQFIKVVDTLLSQSNNTLLLLMMECGRLRTWRAGVSGPIFEYITYYTPNAELSQTHSGQSHALRKALCTDMRGQTDAAVKDVKADVARAARELGSDMAVNSTHYIGVVDEDDHGCYAELLSSVKSANTSVVMSTLVISTYIHGKALFSAVYHKHVDDRTFEAELGIGKSEMLQLGSDNNDN